MTKLQTKQYSLEDLFDLAYKKSSLQKDGTDFGSDFWYIRLKKNFAETFDNIFELTYRKRYPEISQTPENLEKFMQADIPDKEDFFDFLYARGIELIEKTFKCDLQEYIG